MIIILLFLLVYSSTNVASNGIFPLAYSIKALGMGGAIIAYPQDSLAATYNPAGMLDVGTRFDINAKIGVPLRGYSYTGSDTIPADAAINSNKNFFIAPQGGFNIMLGQCTSLGASFYANGLNSSYPENNPVFGTSKLKVDIKQYFAAPTIARTLIFNQHLGVSVVMAYQSVKINGLQNFANEQFSEYPDTVSDTGTDKQFGAGIRLGWFGTLCNILKFGASYTTKIFMKRAEKYKGLIANAGYDNIPALFTAGIAVDCKKIAIAVDYLLIFYDNVPVLGHSIAQLGLPVNPMNIENKLGSKNGPGFGWRNLSVIKAGIAIPFKERMIARAGFSISKVPYPSQEIDFNILGTATIKDHITAGYTYTLYERHDFDLAFAYGVYNTREGRSQLGLGEVKHHQQQFIIAANYGFKF